MNATTLRSIHPAYATVRAYGELPGATRYGARQGPNWVAILAIVALHAVALAALIMLDVIPISRAPKPKPLVMTLIKLAPPPPEAAPPPSTVQDVPPPVAVLAPAPVVKVAAPTPPITVAAIAPPPVPVVSAAPATPASAAAAPIAAPITPPSANAATLNNPAPRYPMDARRKKEEGTVRLRVVITVDGRVKDISVARSSGSASLDDAALDAVRRWKFVPGMQAGQPVEAVGFVPIPFRLT